jgi:hypothetical protein
VRSASRRRSIRLRISSRKRAQSERCSSETKCPGTPSREPIWAGGTFVSGPSIAFPTLPVDSVDESIVAAPPAGASSAARARFSHGRERARHSNEGSAAAVFATSTSFVAGRHRGRHEGTRGRRDAAAERGSCERDLGLTEGHWHTPLARLPQAKTVFPAARVPLRIPREGRRCGGRPSLREEAQPTGAASRSISSEYFP